jgi:hypothetical protein
MRSLLAATLFLVLGACSLPQEGRSRAFAPYAPIEARITAMTPSGPLFHVNRPAYVAMFYIAPGSGVSMLYPGFGSGSLDGRVFAGSHFGNQRINNRDMFAFASRASFGQPRFYFLIASDRPLNVKQFGTFGSMLHARLGTSFMSMSAYNTMEDLAQLALPSLVNDGSWTTDMYVDWPSVISREPARGHVYVRCSGYEMYVPIEHLMAVQAAICEPLEEAQKKASDEVAEPEVVKPKARQPLPADGTVGEGAAEAIRAPDVRDRRAVIERISSSSQLGRPIGRPIVDGGRTEVGRPGARGRPEMGPGPASSSGSGASRGAVTGATSRPSADSGGGAEATPAAAPAAPSRGGGGVSAPSSRPASGGDGGGS